MEQQEGKAQGEGGGGGWRSLFAQGPLRPCCHSASHPEIRWPRGPELLFPSSARPGTWQLLPGCLCFSLSSKPPTPLPTHLFPLDMEVCERTSAGSAWTGPPKAEQSQHQLGTGPGCKAQQSRTAGVCTKPRHQGWPRPSGSKGPKAKWEEWEEATRISLEGQGKKEAVWSAPHGSRVTVNLA